MQCRCGWVSSAALRSPRTLDRSAFVLGLLILAVVLAGYWPALKGSVVWDDLAHLTQPDLRSREGLRQIWFMLGATQQYYPLLHSAFWLEHRAWGDATLGYHLVNVGLHTAVACLFAAVLQRLRVPGAGFAALLFALHPVCVESVAWISEQKNTLSAVFYLGAALAYLKWHGRPAREFRLNTGEPRVPLPCPTTRAWERDRPRPLLFWYVFASFLFLCALFTKTVTATLPAALLVIGWWQRSRLAWRRDVVPLAPWFVLSTASGLLTAWVERKLIGAEGGDFELSLLERGLLAGRVVWFYLGKLLWPAELIFVYPRWHVDAAVWWQWLFPLAALATLFLLRQLSRPTSQPSLSVGVHLGAPLGAASDAPTRSRLLVLRSLWRRRIRSRLSSRARRAPLATALLFGGTLFPVLGFFNVYPFVFSFVADHFQYLAMLPVLAFLAASLTTLSAPWPRAFVLPLGTVVLVLLGVLTHRQAGNYRDEFTLYRATLDRNPDAWLAHNNLGGALIEVRRPAEALAHFEQSLRLHPRDAQTLTNLGGTLPQLGRAAEAVPYLERALQLQPNYAEAHNNLGVALGALNRLEEAVPCYQRAVELRPDYANAHFNLAVAFARLHRRAAAIPHFQQSLQLRPDQPEAELGLALALTSTNRLAESLPHFDRAIALAPDSVVALRTYAGVLASAGRIEAALPYFRRVAELTPQSAEAQMDLAGVLDELGRNDEAQRHRAEAERLGKR